MTGEKILVIGANGQIGTELLGSLNAQLGHDRVIASDIKQPAQKAENAFELLDVTDGGRISEVVKKHGITVIYQLAALLSATAEKHPEFAWDLNMKGLFNVLNLAKEGLIKKVFWPSSIAVFGPTTPSKNVPQHTIMQPTSVYGISKLAGERWCEYYHTKWGVDVRSIRYPGLIGYKGAPGGGTTDYAVDIFHHALESGSYTNFLSEETALPMMYMGDAIKATMQLMAADAEKLSIKSSYNVDSLSFTPIKLVEEIKKHVPLFSTDFMPDYRQQLADSWPDSIDGSIATHDWGWRNLTSLSRMVELMIDGVRSKGNIMRSLS